MASKAKEVAKFMCGVEAFHAFIHAYFWYSGKTLNAFGVTETPTWHKRAAIGSALVSIALGVYAWRDTTTAARETATTLDSEKPAGQDLTTATPASPVLPS